MGHGLIGIAGDRIIFRQGDMLIPIKRLIPVGRFYVPEFQARVIEGPQIILGSPVPGVGLLFQLLQGGGRVFGLVPEMQ